MKSKSMRKLMRRNAAAAMAVITAMTMAAPAMAADTSSASKPKSNTTSKSKQIKSLSKKTVVTKDGKKYNVKKTYTYSYVTKKGTAHEVTLNEAIKAVKAGKKVYVSFKYHEKGYGSVWNSNYGYTTYRTGVQIGTGKKVALGTSLMDATLKNNKLTGYALVSTTPNFNALVVNKAKSVIDNPVIVMGNKNGKNNSDGNVSGNYATNDFVGYGTAVTVYGDTKTKNASVDANGQMGGTTVTGGKYLTKLNLNKGGSITTYGVARPAVEVDNGGDILVTGDGKKSTKEISVNGGTLYKDYKNTADTVKMMNPPWVLGVTGNSRATNMLGQGSTMVIKDSDVYSANWGVLSTDSGSSPHLYAINSNISMNKKASNGVVSGYGSYAIGGAQEYFLGSTFDVSTYMTIATSQDNVLTFGKTTKGKNVQIKKTVWKNNKSSESKYYKVKASKTAQTKVNSENFGFYSWGGTTINLNDATELNTRSAAFLDKTGQLTTNIGKDVKIAAATDANAQAEKAANGYSNGVIYQLMDNDGETAQGISMDVAGYNGPVFSEAKVTEDEGWVTDAYTASSNSGNQGGPGGAPGGAPGGDAQGDAQASGGDTQAAPGGDAQGNSGAQAEETTNTSKLNISSNLQGNIYNSSGYVAKASALDVNIKDGGSVTGAITATAYKHTTDGGKTQNTSFTESEVSKVGHILNKPYYNGANDINLTVGGTWNVEGTNYLSKLTVTGSGKVNGTISVDGEIVTPEAGKTYEGNIVVTAFDNGATVKSISDDNLITADNGKSGSYDSGFTFVTNSGSQIKEISYDEAKAAVKSGQTVKVYIQYRKAGLGSVWGDSYSYTKYRTGVQIGEGSGAALGTSVVGGTLNGTTLTGFNLLSTSANFNPIVINKSDATIDNPVLTVGNADGKNNSDGNVSGDYATNDFVGYGTAVSIYGDTKTENASVDANGQMGGTTETKNTYKTNLDLSNGGSITTYGVARPAVETDNGGDVLIKGDGNDKTTEINVQAGTLYDGYKNTAATDKMMNPPWVLGVTGNARATNMLGQGSTMVVQDTDVYSANWGALSTDSGSTPHLYAINSNVSMNTDASKGVVSGYGTYAIGGAQEYFLGSTFNVPTYMSIATSEKNKLTFGKTTAGEDIQIKKQIWKDNKDSESDYYKVKASKTAETVVNSENFGFYIWGGTEINLEDATELNTKSAAFLDKTGELTTNIGKDVKIAAATDANADAEKAENGYSNGVIYQMMDNDGETAEGISVTVEGYQGPVFQDAEVKEAEGWVTTTKDAKSKNTSTLNISNALEGNIYNATGYVANANTLDVNIKAGGSVKGAITATQFKHTTDGGKTQNTSIKINDVSKIGHIMNQPHYNGYNDIDVDVAGTWTVEGKANYIHTLKVEDGGVVNGTVYQKDDSGNYTKAVTVEAGQTYTDVMVAAAK